MSGPPERNRPTCGFCRPPTPTSKLPWPKADFARTSCTDCERSRFLPLSSHFFEKHASRYGKQLEGFDESARAAMRKHSWPGNVRELDHAVERGVLMAQRPLIATADLGLESGGEAAAHLDQMTLEDALPYAMKFMRRYI